MNLKSIFFNHNRSKFIRDAIDLSPAINRRVHLALVDYQYQHATFTLLSSLFCATLVLIGMMSIEAKHLVYMWYSSFVVITALRWILIISYLQQTHIEKHLQLWRNLFIVSAFIGGVTWGATIYLLMPHAKELQEMLLIFILAGVTAGATPFLASILSSAIIYVICILVPLISYSPGILSLTAFIYLFYLIVLSINIHNMIKNSIGLQFENTLLLDSLSNAKKQLEIINKRLEQAATHDPLTQLANRSLFETAFSQSIKLAHRENKILGLLYLDIDGFKKINDTYGHHVGDKVLLIVVDRITSLLRKSDIVSRLGGDEITIILENLPNAETIKHVAVKIQQAILQPVKIDGHDIKVTVSIGAGVYPYDGEDVHTLLRVADKNMYHVKKNGGNNIHYNSEAFFD